MKNNKSKFTRKLSLVSVLCLLIAALALTGCTAQRAADGAANETAAPTQALISESRAREIALQDAGLTEQDVTLTESRLDRENGVTVYEIDFHTDDAEYEYEIEAVTGRIYSRSIERIGRPAVSDPTADIGLDKAKEIALADAGLTEAAFTTAKKDTENGRTVYELEFHTDSTEYDYEIDAATGAILTKESDEIRQNTPETQVPSESEAADIGLDKAKEIALADAGLTEATFTTTKKDTENGKVVYELEFHTDSTEYDYEIDAATGAILDKDSEARSSGSTTPAPSESAEPTDIGLDRAKAIALADAGLTEAAFTTAKKDTENGKTVYELEFHTDSTEYDYEIDAATGEILDKSIEQIETPAPTSPSANYIGVDQAKQIALQRAKLTASQVTFSKAKLEKEDGRQVYEIEFYVGNTEYSCTIDAVDGSILEYEVEHEDDAHEEDDDDEEDEDDEDDD